MKKVEGIIFLILGIIFIFSPLIAYAQQPQQGFLQVCGVAQDDPSTTYINETQACGFCQIFQLISKIINIFLFPTVPILASIFIVIGGIFILLGGSNPLMLNQGKKILTNVVIGLIIVYGAWVFIEFLLQAFGVTQWTGFGTWWQIPCAQ